MKKFRIDGGNRTGRRWQPSRSGSAKAIPAWILAGAVIFSSGLVRAQYLVAPAVDPAVKTDGTDAGAGAPGSPAQAEALQVSPLKSWRHYLQLAEKNQSFGDSAGGRVTRADESLRGLGYDHPGIADDVWTSMTAYRKIGTGIFRAETASERAGAQAEAPPVSRLRSWGYLSKLAENQQTFGTLAAPLSRSPADEYLGGLAQRHLGLIDSECRPTLGKTAEYLAIGKDGANECLLSLGYDHPGIADDVWRSMTPYGKIETAFVSAETASEGGGGRMLAMLSKSLAIEYESAAHIAGPNVAIERLSFAKLERAVSHETLCAALTPQVRETIQAASSYCEGGLFGPRTVLMEYFGVNEGVANVILRTSRTHHEMLDLGFTVAAEGESAMTKLITELGQHYHTARVDPIFTRWLSEYPVPPPLSPVAKPAWIIPLPVDLPVVKAEGGALAAAERAGVCVISKRAWGALAAIVALLGVLLACGVPATTVGGIGAILVAIWACCATSGKTASSPSAPSSGVPPPCPQRP